MIQMPLHPKEWDVISQAWCSLEIIFIEDSSFSSFGHIMAIERSLFLFSPHPHPHPLKPSFFNAF